MVISFGCRPFLETAGIFVDHIAEVHKNIRAGIAGDKTEALLSVKPTYGTFLHDRTLFPNLLFSRILQFFLLK